VIRQQDAIRAGVQLCPRKLDRHRQQLFEDPLDLIRFGDRLDQELL
jgi:hypothetical protein